MPTKSAYNQSEETLLTKKSLQLSLSAPRCPPFGTAQHSVLLGTKPFNDDPYVAENAQSDYNEHAGNSGIQERLMHLVYDVRLRGLPHPHLSLGPEGSDQVTRFLGSVLPLSWQNSCRDEGGLRFISDSLVTFSIPVGAVTNPSAAVQFMRLTKQVQKIRYGSHESQFIDLFFPDGCRRQEVQGMVFFVHGGAWGSGKPWFYRLVSQAFLEINLAVAIVGYRVYPDANVNEQVQDLDSAYLHLSKHFPDLCGPLRTKRPIGLCIVGHSSGAHIAFLMVVEQAKRMLHVQQSRLESQQNASERSEKPNSLLFVDSFVGMSGPYDISHHFDYEAARGLEELSPMKPANGYTREQFRLNTPALRLQNFLVSFEESSSASLALNHFFPQTLLIHGIEDDVVPFTATSEAARVLRSCGVLKCEEYYAPLTGHQDAVMHLMLGGRVKDAIAGWLHRLGRGEQRQSLLSRL